MNEVVLKEDLEVRSKILALELALDNALLKEEEVRSFKDDDITYKHLFTEKHPKHNVGLYAREMTAVKGSVIIGYIHKDSHITFLNKGKMKILSESNGSQELTAPCSFVSPAGIRRAIHCLEDCIMTCVYISSNPETDKENLSEQLEENLTSFEETLYTDDYKEVGLLPPIPNYKGILSW